MRDRRLHGLCSQEEGWRLCPCMSGWTCIQRGDGRIRGNMKPDLSIEIAGIKLRNPVMLASGTARYGEEISRHCDLNRIGAIIVKGIALKPTPGNPTPRICENPSRMLK